MSENLDHYCMSLLPRAPTAEDMEHLVRQRAAFLNSVKWQSGDVITIRFLQGAESLCQRVKAVALEWTKVANLHFDFRTAGPTDIRIAFQPGKGSWSYIGKDCKGIPEPQPTMNYGWLTPDSPDDEVRRVVLHEFGHAIGLIHEHQNPKGAIQWNRAAVIHDLSGPPNNWDPATIENNMFKKYTDTTGSRVDSHSIMMYPIPKSWTLDGFSAGLNKELSQVDIDMARQVYP